MIDETIDKRTAHITASYSVALIPFMKILEEKGVYKIEGRDNAVFVSSRLFNSLFADFTVDPIDEEAERHVAEYDGVKFYCVHWINRGGEKK